MIRVAFPVLGAGAVWTGGLHYLLNLLRVLDEFAATRVTPVVMLAHGTSSADLAPYGSIGSVECVELPAALSAGRKLSRLKAVVAGRNGPLERWLHSRSIDAVFETTEFLGRRCHIPALTWIPDFQHRHLPVMFERSRRWSRELLYQLQTRAGRTVMLSSESARRDCERFYPGSRGRTVVVPFAVPAIQDPPDGTLARRYALPDEFLYLPNQFWKHKNHGVIIEALALLRRQHNELVVVASGNPSDVRNPRHFAELTARAAALRLGAQWRIVGMVPSADVRGLMRAGIAVINPSLFEGWSTTVEEAKSLGVPLVLSDLAVHREQVGDAAVFFDPHSPASAAAALAAALERFRALPRGLSRAVDPDCAHRLREFSTAFCDAVELAITRTRGLNP
jgi:glycosyltransferase involved in cell wall biosynthesis